MAYSLNLITLEVSSIFRLLIIPIIFLLYVLIVARISKTTIIQAGFSFHLISAILFNSKTMITIVVLKQRPKAFHLNVLYLYVTIHLSIIYNKYAQGLLISFIQMPQSIHYTRYVLSSRSTRLTSMSTTRSWSGSPTAAILHAAEVILQLKPYENTPLKHLQDRTRLLLSLYARPSPQVIETVPNLKDIPCGVDAHELGKVEMRKRAEKYLQDIRRSGTKGRKAYSELKDKHLLIDVDGSWYEDSDSDEQDDRDYHWGPKSSSADKIKFVRKKGVEPVYDMMFGP